METKANVNNNITDNQPKPQQQKQPAKNSELINKQKRTHTKQKITHLNNQIKKEM